jgi:hypothetical protein
VFGSLEKSRQLNLRGAIGLSERVKSEVEVRISPSRDQFEASRTWLLPDELTGYI